MAQGPSKARTSPLWAVTGARTLIIFPLVITDESLSAQLWEFCLWRRILMAVIGLPVVSHPDSIGQFSPTS